MSKLISIRVPDELKQQLDEIKKHDDIEFSALFRDSLKRIIAIHRLKKARAKAMPYAEKLGLFTDEDVFNKIKS